MKFSTNHQSNYLKLETLEARDVPTTLASIETLTGHPQRYAVAAGSGQPAQVSVYERGTNALLSTITPFETTYTGGVSVVTGDITGDGIDDIVVAKMNSSSQVKIFDGATNKVVADFEAFAGTTTGATVALGDVTGDGRVDLVVGGMSTIRIYRAQALTAAKPAATSIFQPFGPSFYSGVRVAVGDVNGDGIADIIAAPGAGFPATVKVFTTAGKWGDTTPTAYQAGVSTITVGGATDRGGVFVSAADHDGDGKADIAVGRVVAGRAMVTVYKGDQPRKILQQAFGFQNTQPGGVPVAMRDLDGDGRADLIVGSGTNSSQVRVIGNRGGLMRSFFAFTPEYRGGVFVG